MRSTYTRSEFELYQSLKRDCLNAIDLNRYVRRIWKSDWFRQAIARIFSGRHNLNANVSLRGAKLFSRALKSGTITEPDQFVMKPRQAFFGKQQVDVLGETPISMLIQGDCANHHVVNSAIFQRPRESFQRCVKHPFTGKKPQAFIERGGWRGNNFLKVRLCHIELTYTLLYR